MEKMFSGLSSVVRTESFTSMEASYSTEVKTTSTETRIKSRPTPDRDEMKTLRGWDQVKTKNSTNYRHSSNRSEIQYIQLPRKKHLQKINLTTHLFTVSTSNPQLSSLSETDQDWVTVQSSPRRDGDSLLATTNANQYLWQVPPQLPVCRKQLLQSKKHLTWSIVQKYFPEVVFIHLHVLIQQWKYTLLTAAANYALLNKHELHEDKLNHRSSVSYLDPDRLRCLIVLKAQSIRSSV